jgi:hypothetical protein
VVNYHVNPFFGGPQGIVQPEISFPSLDDSDI